MKASDIMTFPVVTIGPDTRVRAIAELLVKHRISGVPVVDGGRLAGFVSEGDLLHRQEIGTDREPPARSWWLRLLSAGSSPADYVKSHAVRARDIMTREVVSVSPHTSLAEIAALLERHGIKRVPVLSGAQLVGIVSRANLVQAIALADRSAIRVTPPADSAIRWQLLAELERHSWWPRVSSNVRVREGVVHYWGIAESDDERAAARVAAENVPGVRAVEDHRFTYAELPFAE